jgi:hypothetical protein
MLGTSLISSASLAVVNRGGEDADPSEGSALSPNENLVLVNFFGRILRGERTDRLTMAGKAPKTELIGRSGMGRGAMAWSSCI